VQRTSCPGHGQAFPGSSTVHRSLKIRRQRQRLGEHPYRGLVRWIAGVTDRECDSVTRQATDQGVGAGHRTGQPEELGDNERVAAPSCRKCLAQRRARSGNTRQPGVEVHSVWVDAEPEQLGTLAVGVRPEPRHSGIADHQRGHSGSVSDEPPARECAPDTPCGTALA
jgi:hypothetical protein